MEFLNTIAKNLTTYWNQLNKKQKVILAGGAAAIILTVAIFIYFFTKPTYISLYNEPLDYETSGAIQTVLTAQNIKFKATDDGKNVLVDKASIGKARIAISTESLPTTKYTWKEALNKNTLGLTEAEKNINFKYAKEQELATAIENINGVKSAVVNLTLPSSDPFLIKSKQVAQAGVQLGLNKELNAKQIAGIANFVLASVDSLTLENISIIDTDANILYPQNGDIGMSVEGFLSSEYDKIQKEKEEELAKKVVQLLSPSFDDIRVTVNLKINFDKYKETKEMVSSPFENGKSGIVTEEHVTSDTGTNQSATGEPGYGSNDEDTSYQVEDGTGSSYESTTRDTYYKVNTTVAELEKRIGETILADSSMSAIVYKNQIYDYKTLKKKGSLKDITWEEYMQQIKIESLANKFEVEKDLVEVIQNGTGIQEVKITGYYTPIFIGPETFNYSTLIDRVIPILILFSIVIGVAIIVIKKAKDVHIVETEPELSVEAMLKSTREKEYVPVIEEKYSETAKRLSEFIDEKPELVAQLLRNWINEE